MSILSKVLFEYRSLDVLLSVIPNFKVVCKCESPDFVICDTISGKKIGVEVTQYFPHRDKKSRAVIMIKNFLYKFFHKTDFGHFRFVPSIDWKDFGQSCLSSKLKKLDKYSQLHPECVEFWLLVVLNRFDDVNIETVKLNGIRMSYNKNFHRLFIIDGSNELHEIPVF